jgi:hypothetical protein
MALEKRNMIALFKESPLNAPLIRKTGQQLEKDIHSSIERLANISNKLKQQYQEQGKNVTKELENTLVGKTWLRESVYACDLTCTLGPDEPARWARDAEKSVDALDSANTELAKLTAKAKTSQ